MNGRKDRKEGMNGRRDGKEGMERRREWDEQKRNIEGMQNNGWFNSKEGGGI